MRTPYADLISKKLCYMYSEMDRIEKKAKKSGMNEQDERIITLAIWGCKILQELLPEVESLESRNIWKVIFNVK